MADVVEQIEQTLSQAVDELTRVATPVDLEAFRIKYLGAKGAVKGLMTLLGQVPKDQKPMVGQKVNAVRDQISAAFEARKSSLVSTVSTGPLIDVTEPGVLPAVGNRHVLMKVVDELTDLFARMGFAKAYGPEVEDEFHNFVALNIPESHPARDPLDNYYIDNLDETGRTKDEANADVEGTSRPSSVVPHPSSFLLRTQTSTVQIRVMETQAPPIRVVIPGRVYRPDTHDDTHLSMFHQLEALVVDKDVTMIDLKSTILQFVKAYFGEATRVRFRPSFFPFTEPSAEVDVWFEGLNRWIELGGCGMVHPNVLRACNIDPDVYSGWAFGFGIERIAMRKYGINNIRLFVENDVRFLSQF